MTFPITPGAIAGAIILVAEDHDDSREAVQALLEAVGYRVVVAVDGREAVRVALDASPDLVLMDLMMPVMDGYEATRRLRADTRFRQVPILALSAAEGGRDPALEAGCDDFIAKPIEVGAFFGILRQWLEGGRGQ